MLSSTSESPPYCDSYSETAGSWRDYSLANSRGSILSHFVQGFWRTQSGGWAPEPNRNPRDPDSIPPNPSQTNDISLQTPPPHLPKYVCFTCFALRVPQSSFHRQAYSCATDDALSLALIPAEDSRSRYDTAECHAAGKSLASFSTILPASFARAPPPDERVKKAELARMNRAGKKQYGNWIIRDEIVTTLLDIFFSLPPTNPIDQFLKTTETYALCLPYVCQIFFFFT